MIDEARKQKKVKYVLLVEGLGNLVIFCLKIVVGFSTGSFAILGDAIHSLADILNNIIALFIINQSFQPPDKEHPYGHQKYETIAVFGLATLLTILAFELGLNSFRSKSLEVFSRSWEVYFMLGTLILNIILALWQRGWSKKLDSQILLADSHHTFADVLTTIVVIISWQLSSQGYYWVDRVCALLVSGLIFYLAFGLFKRSVPILVDSTDLEHDLIKKKILKVSGVNEVLRIRSRNSEGKFFIDIIISVNPDQTITSAHDITDEIEHLLKTQYPVLDTIIHVEPSF
jgi:cation diffusion facilitator family transporter